MTTMADSLVNSAMRPLKLRCRPDLISTRHKYHGRVYWVIKEPVGLNYFRFHEEEYAILRMLDGKNSLNDIKENFQRQFAPQRITLQDLQQFVGMLHRSGLVISNASGQGRQLRRRGDQRKKRELLGKLANVFALRFRGIDPERILNFLIPFTWWLFTPACILAVMMLGLSALMLVGLEYHEFRAKLPTFEQFFAADKWIYWARPWPSSRSCMSSGTGSVVKSSAVSVTKWDSCSSCSRPVCTAMFLTHGCCPINGIASLSARPVCTSN